MIKYKLQVDALKQQLRENTASVEEAADLLEEEHKKRLSAEQQLASLQDQLATFNDVQE